MKKGLIIILSIISLIATFILAEIFCIYHFESVPTLLTSLYLISIFAILEYLTISITSIIRKLIKKEKLGIKKIIGLTLLFIALLLILWFIIVIDIDWLNWYAYSTPFYINVIVKALTYLLPSVILIIVGIMLLRKGNSK